MAIVCAAGSPVGPGNIPGKYFYPDKIICRFRELKDRRGMLPVEEVLVLHKQNLLPKLILNDVYMQNRLFINLLAGMALLLAVSSCQKRVIIARPTSSSSAAAKGLPPGQAKKLYGHQSAKAFAPGQQKKKGSTIVIVNGKDSGHKKKGGKKK
ncbi:hypothetical protein [Botryobacter ruber]|uniref:hypothetical protein n=1 Tax=Botryobacter ruber TaxID=2171629 RepID=UPI00196A6A2A|nr:hypothetical protein [Botryobacter ruber]